MRMNQHLTDLLYRYECVTLPGFGSFLSRRMAAQLYSSTDSFYPPKKGLSFNAQLIQNDGLLARHLVAAEGISYDEAMQHIGNYTRELRSSLENEGRITIDNLGVFSRTEDGQVAFLPTYLVNFLPEAFGLSSFTATQADRTRVEEEVSVFTLPEETKTTKATPWLRYAAVGVLLVGLGGAYLTNQYRNQTINHNIVEQQKADKIVESRIQEATFVLDALPAIDLNVEKRIGMFHVVAGAFREEANADKKVSQLQKAGYDAHRIGANKYGLHTVAFDSYETRREATNALNKIKRSFDQSAWLYIKKI